MLNVERCNVSKFGEKYESLLDQNELNNSYCLQNFNLSLSGGFKYDQFSYIRIKIQPCINSTQNNFHCKPQHIIDSYLSSAYFSMLIKDIAFKDDMEFNKKCKEFENIITLEDLKIPEEIYDPSIFDKIVSHIKMMDNARTPEEMLKEFELAVQLINSLFIFMMDKKETGSDNLTPVIIYVIIKAKPARLNFNIKFIKYFFDI